MVAFRKLSLAPKDSFQAFRAVLDWSTNAIKKNATGTEVTAFEADRAKTIYDRSAWPDSNPFLPVDALWTLSS